MDESMGATEHAHGETPVAEHGQHDSGLAPIGRFFRHLLEMIIAMFLGMGIYAVIFGLLLDSSGHPGLARAYPELRYGLMGVFMAAPMVLLMRVRGHSWERGGEMAAAMIAPMVAVVLCWRLGLGGYVPLFSEQAMPLSAHMVMYVGMVAVMLYRRNEYTHSHSHSHAEPHAHAAS